MFRSIALAILLSFCIAEGRTLYADSVLTDTGTVGTGFALFSGKAYWRPSKGIAWREIKVVPDSSVKSSNSDSLDHRPKSYYDTVGNGARDSLLALRLPLHGKADSAALADSTIKNGVHGVTQYRLPYSDGTNLWGTSELRYDPSYST